MIVCDRCKQEVKDAIDDKEAGMTGGFYQGWKDFMNGDENIICDACMLADPRYIKIYGKHS
jgi:hypothetical protein